MRHILTAAALSLPLAALLSAQAPAPPLKLAIAGLVHGHVTGFLRAAEGRTDIQIVGIFDPDKALQQAYATKYKLDPSLFFSDLGTMLDRTKPEAVASFTSTYDHPMVVEAAA